MTIRLRDALNQQSTLITETGLTDTFLVLDGATIRKIAPTNLTVDWTKILNKPTTFPPEAHNHDTAYEPKNANIQAHISSTSNPHSVTKTQVGLENVLNKEQKVYHGFVDRTSSTLSFDNSTRTFTLGTSTSYSVYIDGTKITKATNLSVQIGTGLGQHFIWFTAAGTLATSQTVWSLLDTSVTPVATIYWTGTIGIVAEERHDYRRNLIEHNNQHDSCGTQYVSGFTNTPTFTNANTFTFAGGVIRDEDIYIAISSPQTQAMLGYRAVGGASMLFDTASTAYVKLNGTTPQYDNVGTLTNIPITQYGVQWIYATNRIATPISIIVGQGTYISVAAAQAAPMPTLAGFSVAEWKLLYRVIIRNNAGTLQYIQADTLYNVSTGPAIQGSSISTVSASNVTFIPSGDLIATNVQNALIELDTEKAPSAKGVTNGDSHDHNGGDGAQINHTTLSNIGTNTHAQIDTFIASKAQANGIASLDAAGKLDSAQIPSGIGGDIDWTNYVSINTATTLETGKHYVCSGTSMDYTITLPSVTTNIGTLVSITMNSALTKLVTVDAGTGVTIDGQQTRTMWANETAILMSNGTSWTKVGGKSIPFCCVIRRTTGDQSVSASTWTAIQFDTFISGDSNMYDTTNKRITIRRTGQYTCSGFMYLASGPASFVYMSPLVAATSPGGTVNNGYSAGAQQAAYSYATSYSAAYSATSGQYVSLAAYSGVSQTIKAINSVYPQLAVLENITW